MLGDGAPADGALDPGLHVQRLLLLRQGGLDAATLVLENLKLPGSTATPRLLRKGIYDAMILLFALAAAGHLPSVQAALAASRAELRAEFAHVNAHRSDIASKEVVHMVVVMQDAMRRAAAALDPVVGRFPQADVRAARAALAASHERGPLDAETFAKALQHSAMMTGLGHERADPAAAAQARKARRNGRLTCDATLALASRS